jgi:hypothetical protein
VNTPLLTRRAKTLIVDRNYGHIYDYAINQYKTLLAEAQDIPRRATDIIKESGTNTIMFAHKLLARAKEFSTSADGFKMGEQFFASPPSNVMRRLPGFSIGVSAFGGSLIDTTQFGWRFMVRLILRIITARKGEDMSPVMWQVFSDSTEDFDTYLVKPGFRACAGLGVMLGYSNPWARVFRESCSSAVASQATVLDIVDVLFIRVPTLACICRDSAGENFATYASTHCWAPAPSNMKPQIAKLISDSMSGQRQSAICKNYGIETDDLLRSSMDPVMQHAFAATEAVGSAIDYLTKIIDPEAGNCANLVTSPYTMAIVPEPIDYFRGCSRTNTCRSKCLVQFTEFDEVRLRLAEKTRIVTLQSTVEKKFFSQSDVIDGKSNAPFEILALMEVDATEVISENPACCGSGDTRDRCVVICGINSKTLMEVVEYCVPHNIGMGTHQTASWVVDGSDTWTSSVRSVHFSTRRELIVATVNTVIIYNADHSPVYLMQSIDALASKRDSGLDRIAWVFAAPGNFCIIHGFVNSPEQTFSKKMSLCVELTPGRTRRAARPCVTNLDTILYEHTATCIGEDCTNLLMLPTTREGTARYCIQDGFFSASTQMKFKCVDSAPDPMIAHDLGFSDSSGSAFVTTSEFLSVRRSPLMSANTLSLGNASMGVNTRVFNANPSSKSSTWLQEVRLNWDLSTGSLISDVRKSGGQKASVNVVINQRCAVDDCSGCINSVVQRACYATQQCSVTKCIGTVVNLERPMCSVGRLLQAGLDVDIVKMQGDLPNLDDLTNRCEISQDLFLDHRSNLELRRVGVYSEQNLFDRTNPFHYNRYMDGAYGPDFICSAKRYGCKTRRFTSRVHRRYLLQSHMRSQAWHSFINGDTYIADKRNHQLSRPC